MTHRTRTRTATGPRALGRGLAAAGGAAVLALGLGACGDTTGDEDGASVEDVQEDEAVEESAAGGLAYEGAYDQAFYDEQDTYVGEEVTLSASVNEVISDSAFTIAGQDSGVDELLVVSAGSSGAVAADAEVDVSGTVMETFDVVTVEEELRVDLDDTLYTDYEGQNYLSASSVDTGVEGDT